MTNSHLLANNEGIARVGMQNRGILHITILTNLNEVVIAADNNLGPHARIFM